MESSRAKVLMPVYNEIEYDGRVQRIAEAEGRRYAVTVVDIDSGKDYCNPHFALKRIALPGSGGIKLVRHLLFWLRFWLLAIRIKPDAVHAHDYFLAFPGWVAARLTGARLIYDAHELIIPEPGATMSRRDRFFYLLEKWVVGRAELVIAANRHRAELMQAHYRLSVCPTEVQNISPQPATTVDRQQVLELYPQLTVGGLGQIRLVYQGDMHSDRGVDHFVRAMKHLDSRFQLVLVGSGRGLDALLTVAQEERIRDRVISLGRVPREALYGILSLCDIGIVTYPTVGLNNIYCASNKLYDYVQAGLPVVCTDQPPLLGLISEFGVGAVIHSRDAAVLPLEIASVVSSLADMLNHHRAGVAPLLAINNWEEEEARLLAALAAMGLR